MVTSFVSNKLQNARLVNQRSHHKIRKLYSSESPCGIVIDSLHRANKTTDRFEDVREYYDFLEHKRNVKFLPHPTRGEASQFEPFELVLNSKINYDTLSERVGSELGVPATHIRFWTVNVATNNPKAPVRRGTNPSLRQILHPMGANTFTSSQRNDSFFLEVLDMSLAEFDTKKNIKVTWLSEGITKEVG